MYSRMSKYLEQFTLLTRNMDKKGTLVYNESDEETRKIANSAPGGIHRLPYQCGELTVIDGQITVNEEGKKMRFDHLWKA